MFTSDCMPIYPLYAIMFSERSGLSTAQISELFSIWIAIALFSEIPTGALADRYSRKWSLVIGRLLQGLAFAVWLIEPSFWVYAAGFVIWGIGFAFSSGSLQAYLYDELASIDQSDEFTRIYTRSQALLLAGMALAYISASLIGASHYSLLLSLSIGVSVVSAAFYALLRLSQNIGMAAETSPSGILERVESDR